MQITLFPALLTLLSLATGTTASANEAFIISTQGSNINWQADQSDGYNVHLADGSYLLSLSGGATSWRADSVGNYFVVQTNGMDWRNWIRSNTVSIADTVKVTQNSDNNSDRNFSNPAVAGPIASWKPVNAKSINVHSANGAYITSISGNATQWRASFPGDYFFVATNERDWTHWNRSSVVTLSATKTSSVPNTINKDNADKIVAGIAKIMNVQNVVNLFESTPLGIWMLTPRFERGETDGISLLDSRFISGGSEGNTTELAYSCRDGGGLSIRYFNVFKQHDNRYQFNDCMANGKHYNGVVFNSRFSSSGGRSNSTRYENFTIYSAVNGMVLQSWSGNSNWGSSRSSDQSRQWEFTDAVVQDSTGEIRMSDIDREAGNPLELFSNNSSGTGGDNIWALNDDGTQSAVSMIGGEFFLNDTFRVSAPWTDATEVLVQIGFGTNVRKIKSTELPSSYTYPRTLVISDQCPNDEQASCVADESKLNTYLLSDSDESIREWQQISIRVTAKDGSSIVVRENNGNNNGRLRAEISSADGTSSVRYINSFPVYVNEHNLPIAQWWSDRSDAHDVWAVRQ